MSAFKKGERCGVEEKERGFGTKNGDDDGLPLQILSRMAKHLLARAWGPFGSAIANTRFLSPFSSSPSSLLQPPSPPSSTLWARPICIDVYNNDLESALRLYARKWRLSKMEDKLRDHQVYTKPNERRKLAKHYKKLNAARRDITERVKIVRAQMAVRAQLRKEGKL